MCKMRDSIRLCALRVFVVLGDCEICLLAYLKTGNEHSPKKGCQAKWVSSNEPGDSLVESVQREYERLRLAT